VGWRACQKRSEPVSMVGNSSTGTATVEQICIEVGIDI